MRRLGLAGWIGIASLVMGRPVAAAPIPIGNASFERLVRAGVSCSCDGQIPGRIQAATAREWPFRQALDCQSVPPSKTYAFGASRGTHAWFSTYGLAPSETKPGLWAAARTPSSAETMHVSWTFLRESSTYGTVNPVSSSVDSPDDANCAGWTRVVGVDQTAPGSIAGIHDVKLDSATTSDWMGNQIGVTDDNWVPEPWTPLALVSSDPVVVACWGRQYTFSASGLTSVQSQSSELLASPMLWDVYVYKDSSDRNHRVTWSPGSTTVTAQAPGAIEFTAYQLGDVFGLRLTCRGRIEFDGFVKLAFRVESASPVTVNRITVDTPFRSTYATLAHYFPKVPVWYGGVTIEDINAGAVPTGGWSSVFLPHVWLGNEDKGMQWLCESDQGWKPADPENAIQILPSGGTTTLRFNLVGTPTMLTSTTPSDYTFAYEASPVKPVAADRYTWHYTHVGGCYDVLSKADLLRDYGVNAVSTHTWTEWLGYPKPSIPRNIPVLQWATTAAHDRDMDMMVFQSFLLSDAAPEYPDFIDECKVVDQHAYTCPGYVDDTVYAVCQNSVWSDFEIMGIDETMRDFDLDGIYSDSMTCVGNCSNAAHGCGYVGDNGERHPTVAIFATRDFTKRLYRVLEAQGAERGRRMKLVGHTSANIMLPALGFCDAYLDTEHLTNMDRPFTIPLDVFRAEFMGRNFGIPAQTLSYYSGTGKGLTVQEMLAISLLHDAEEPWAYDFMSPVWNAWDSFGMSDVRFLPYWREWGWHAPEGVKVSAYSKPGGTDMLIVAANLGGQQAQGDLVLPRMIASATDAFTGTAVTVQDGKIVDTFPVWQLRMYRVHLADSNIRDALIAADGSGVACSGVVSAAFDGFFYIESPDRTCGIRVTRADHGLVTGETATVFGHAQRLDSGERHIAAGLVCSVGGGAVAPVGMSNKALGGGDNGTGQPGVTDGVGLNNIGLLVKTTGMVVDTSGQPVSFVIDDGSGVNVTVLGAVPPGAEYVIVTGISSCMCNGATRSRRIIATEVSAAPGMH